MTTKISAGRLCDSDVIITEEHDKGGMNSTMYRVCINQNGKQVCEHLAKAIKLDTESKRRAFEKEAEIYKVASDAGIAPPLYSSFICDGYGFIITKYIRPVHFPASDNLVRQVRKKLQALLEAGIIHHDTKEDNILIERGGFGKAPTIYIVDYGNSYLKKDLSMEEYKSKVSSMKIMLAGKVWDKLEL